MNHRYDLRRLDSKYDGKCKGCGEYYDQGEKVLWGKVDGVSMTFHGPKCIPRDLQLSWPPDKPEPRTEREGVPTDSGGHARHDPDGDTAMGSRLIIDRLDALNSQGQKIVATLLELRAQVLSIAALVEKQPF